MTDNVVLYGQHKNAKRKKNQRRRKKKGWNNANSGYNKNNGNMMGGNFNGNQKVKSTETNETKQQEKFGLFLLNTMFDPCTISCLFFLVLFFFFFCRRTDGTMGSNLMKTQINLIIEVAYLCLFVFVFFHLLFFFIFGCFVDVVVK